jgi:hypothetical protein
LRLEILDAETEAQKKLARMFAEGGGVTLPEGWGKSSHGSRGDTESELLRGHGYLMKLHFSNWGGKRKRRLHGYMHLAVARGDLRYGLRPIRWLEVRDDKGNDLAPFWQKEAQAKDPAWWRRMSRGSMTTSPDNRTSLINLDLDLPDLSARKVALMRGVYHALFAVQWDSLVVDRLDEPGRGQVLEGARLRMTWLGHETRQGRQGYFFRLGPLADFRPVPYVTHGAPHVLVLAAGGNAAKRVVDSSLWSRKDNTWDFVANSKKGAFEGVEIRVLAGVALVRIPFEFRDVPIPGEPLAPPPPDPFAGTPKPSAGDLSVRLIAPGKVHAYGEAVRFTLRITNSGKTPYYLDRGQVYEHLCLDYSYPGVGGQTSGDGHRNLQGSPFKAYTTARLVPLRPGGSIELPLTVTSIGRKTFGEVTVDASFLQNRQAYWHGRTCWEGRSREVSATVRFEEPRLVKLERRLAGGKRVPPEEARREVERELAFPRGKDWAWRVFRNAPRVATPVLFDMLEEGRDDVARLIDACLASKSIPKDEREKLVERRNAVASKALLGHGPIPDGNVRAYLEKNKDVTVESLTNLLSRAGKRDREAIAWALVRRKSDRETWDTIVKLCDDQRLREIVAVSMWHDAPCDLIERVYVKTADPKLLRSLAFRGGHAYSGRLIAGFAEADEETKTVVLWCLAGAGPEADSLARAVIQSEKLPIRLAALAVLATPGREGAEAALERASKEDEDAEVRRRATGLLRDIRGEPPPVPDIRRVTDECFPKLADLPDPDAALLAAADPESPDRGRVLVSVAYLTQERHLPKLRRLLGGTDDPLKVAAMEAVSRLGDPGSVKLLEALIRSPPENVSRETVARALVRLGTPDAVQAVRRFAESQEEEQQKIRFNNVACFADPKDKLPPCRSEVPGLFMSFKPHDATGNLYIYAQSIYSGHLRLVPSAAGEPFAVRLRAKDLATGRTTYWRLQARSLFREGRMRMPGPTSSFGGRGYSLPANLSRVLGRGDYEVSLELFTLAAGKRMDHPFLRNYAAGPRRREELLLPPRGLKRVFAPSQRVTVGAETKPWAGESLPWRAADARADLPDGDEIAELRSEAMRALLAKDFWLRVPHGSQAAVAPLLRLAAAGDGLALPLALEASASEDAYTAWGGRAARRLRHIASQPEARRLRLAAEWLAGTYLSPEDFFVSERTLVPLLIHVAGDNAARAVLAEAMRQAPHPWLREDAAERLRSEARTE